MEKIVALCKRRGFIFQSSEIYGGIGGFWDYGPLGTELKRNIKNEWWKSMVSQRDDVVGVDAAIIMNPEVWKASGHTEAFADLLIECKNCHKRFREDAIRKAQDEIIRQSTGRVGSVALSKKQTMFAIAGAGVCPNCGHKEFTKPKVFNLLTEVFLGVTEPKDKAFLRGEITQGAFVNFGNVVSSTRIKIPFGIAQIGKAFRNEITPGNFTFRSREFEQMELEFFVQNNEKEADKWFKYWKDKRLRWYLSLGMKKENLRTRVHEEHEKAHYAKHAEDIEYNAPFGWSEFEGIHNRGDWDLSAHKLTYKKEGGEEFTPWVIETSGGVDRSALFFLIDSYSEEKDRVVLKLHPNLSPIKVAVFPLLANKLPLAKMARTIYDNLKKSIKDSIAFDDRGNIGKRYYSQDEIGTPFCITVDFQSLEDDTVTVRDRDTTKQERVKVNNLVSYIQRIINK